MKKQAYLLTMLILIGFFTGCKNFSEDSQKIQATQTTSKVKNQKTEPPVEDSMTFNEFKRAVRTGNHEDFIGLGTYGSVQMPAGVSVLSSSIRHLGGGYYGAIIREIYSPIMSVSYIEFHPTHEYSVISVFGGSAGRSTQFKNWTFGEGNEENLSPDQVPYFKALLSVLENGKSDYSGAITELSCDLMDSFGNNYREGRLCKFSYSDNKLQVGVDIYGFSGEYVGQDSCQYRPYNKSKGCFFLALEGDDNPFRNEHLSKLFQ